MLYTHVRILSADPPNFPAREPRSEAALVHRKFLCTGPYGPYENRRCRHIVKTFLADGTSRLFIELKKIKVLYDLTCILLALIEYRLCRIEVNNKTG